MKYFNNWIGSLASVLALSTVATAQVVRNEQVVFDGRVGGHLKFQDYFGFSVDATDGRCLVGSYTYGPISAPFGAAFIYERAPGGWAPGERLVPSADQDGSLFGFSVALEGDVVVASAPFWDSSIGLSAGRVYVFERSGMSWQETAILEASDSVPQHRFGGSVAISGNRILVGASGDDQMGIHAGAGYVFERSGGGWVEVNKLLPPPGSHHMYAGSSVALDGNTAVLGAPLAGLVGAAYVYEHSSPGWQLTGSLYDPVPSSSDYFGASVAVHGDVIVVGQPSNECGSTHPGAVFIFEKVSGTWTLLQESRASDGSVVAGCNDQFGLRVDVLGDRILVGAMLGRVDGYHTGKAYLFERSGGVWLETTHLVSSQAQQWELTGSAVALTESMALVGAKVGTAYGIQAGEAYGFDLPLGEVYCTSPPNSTGLSGKIRVGGCVLADMDTIRFEADQLPPGQPGLFFAGMIPTSIPNFGGGQGTLCTGSVTRLDPVMVSDAAGHMELELDTGALTVLAGLTWHFQAWYRDANPLPTFNMTDGVRVMYR